MAAALVEVETNLRTFHMSATFAGVRKECPTLRPRPRTWVSKCLKVNLFRRAA